MKIYKKIISVMLTAAIILSLAACSQPGDGPGKVSEDAPQLFMLSGGGMSANGRGAYEIVPYDDGTGDIVYYDFASAGRVLLSSDPAAAHSPDSTAYIDSLAGGAKIYVSEKRLYILRQAQVNYSAIGSSTGPTIIKMGLSGANRRVKPLRGNIILSDFGGVAADSRGNLYFIIYSMEEGDRVYSSQKIVKYNFDSGEMADIATFDSSVYVRISGAQAGSLLLDIREYDPAIPGRISATRLCSCNPFTGRQRVIATFEGNIPLRYDGQGGVLYTDDTFNLVRLDTGSGRATPVADLAVTGGSAFSVYGVWGSVGIIAAYSESSAYPDYYTVNLASGEINKSDMFYDLGGEPEFMEILAATEDSFFIRCGRRVNTVTGFGTDGTPYTYTRTDPVYAMILKADYLSGRKNYTVFKDMTGI